MTRSGLSSAPKGYTTFGITASPGVIVDVIHGPPVKKSTMGASKWPLDPELEVTLQVKAASSRTDDEKVRVSYYGPKTSPVQALIYITGVELSLSADVTRTGRVKPAQAGKDQSTWTWGPGGRGAILLVNCDKEDPQASGMDFEDDKILDKSNPELPEALVFQDSVTFRVAPWIMTPNTQPPQEVYVCRVSDNEDFLKSLATLTKKAKCKLTVCPEEENIDDQWMQDEMEIGYIQAPHKTLPVVFDSPRDRGLKDFPVKRVMGPNFGYVTRKLYMSELTGLDAFGNLEVSPPVTVRGKEYPLGRILIGNSGYSSSESRDMHQALQDFLSAQQVQAPVRLFSDWLFVGHVDEFLSFVPARDKQGFRLLLSSPRACYQLFQELQSQGHGEATLFEGLKRKRQTINEILSNKKLRDQNAYVESCIDWNRAVLKRELGLAEGDIIDIPQLFKLAGNSRGNSKAQAFFPNMVNMLVLGKYLGIPKPFGPIIDGHCCLEEEVRSHLEPLGLHCTFINDFYTYHVYNGEVHCGTNVRRKPFTFKWWHMVP